MLMDYIAANFAKIGYCFCLRCLPYSDMISVCDLVYPVIGRFVLLPNIQSEPHCLWDSTLIDVERSLLLTNAVLSYSNNEEILCIYACLTFISCLYMQTRHRRRLPLVLLKWCCFYMLLMYLAKQCDSIYFCLAMLVLSCERPQCYYHIFAEWRVLSTLIVPRAQGKFRLPFYPLFYFKLELAFYWGRLKSLWWLWSYKKKAALWSSFCA